MKTQTSYVAALVLGASFLATLAVRSRTPPTSTPPKNSAAAASKQRPERPFGIAARTPWKTSRLTGSPEPPHQYRIERAFPKLAFKNPLLLTRAPGTDRLFIAEHAG
jgi:hypothetical protein